MGVLNGKHVFTSKFITAVIIDGAMRAYFVPIKHVFGDYFLAKLDNQLYAFEIEGQRVATYRHTLAKSFQFTVFYTSHYRAVSHDSELVKLLLKSHKLPRMNNLFTKLLKYICLLYTSPSPRDRTRSRMPSSA